MEAGAILLCVYKNETYKHVALNFEDYQNSLVANQRARQIELFSLGYVIIIEEY